MCSALRRVVLAARLAVVATLLTAIAFAQRHAGSASEPKDTFSSVHQELSDAAERSLAAVLTNQAWMNSPNSPTNPGSPSFPSQGNSILKVRAAIDRVNQLKPTLEPIVRSEGVPVELSAIVLVESGGLTAALSPKGARGVWQFMPDTARRYGLLVDGLHDERTDVVKATHAAARYLRDLHFKFGDWRLALAAYNAGELEVSKAINRSQSHDFGSVRDRGYLPLETRNYIPAIGVAMNRLHYDSSWLASHETMDTPNMGIVYASSGSGE